MGPRGIRSIFVGYAQNSIAYKFLDLQSNVIVELREAEFFENKLSKYIVEYSNPIIERQSMPQKKSPKSSKRYYDAPTEPQRSQKMLEQKSLGNEFVSSQALVFLVEGDRTSVTHKIPIVSSHGRRGSKDVQWIVKQYLGSKRFASRMQTH